MIETRWPISDLNEDQQTPRRERSAPSLVSLHFVRSALRRRWVMCVLSAVLGLLMAAAFLVAFPTSHQAKATLALAHDPQVEPTRAMATDVSLLRTRTVASKTIAKLGLAVSPEDFLKGVTAEPVSSELLTLTISGPSDAEAVGRLTALTSVYLEFRAEQISLQSNVLVGGIQQRITKLQKEVASLSSRIEKLSAAGSSSASKLSDQISQRAYVQSRIETLQQSLEDATLETTALVASSRVIDPPAVEEGSVKRRIVLTLASGLIGGTAVGCGLVLFFAITSDRLRRRSDVAAALEVPVPLSVGRIKPLSRLLRRLPYLRTLDSRRADERQRLAHAIEMELPLPQRAGRLAVACIENADEVRLAVASAATDLAGSGRSVAVIDLSEQGNLDIAAAGSIRKSAKMPIVLRPRGIPALADSPADLHVVGDEDEIPPSLDRDVTLVLADLDPKVGVDHLRAWTDRLIVVVTAGSSSAEGVRTAADCVRVAGLEMRVAALLHTERTDDSSGTAGFDLPSALHLVDWHDQPGSAEVSAHEAPVTHDLSRATDDLAETTDDEQVALEQQQSGMEDHSTVQMATIPHQPTDEQSEEQSAGVELAADEEPDTTAHEEPAAHEEQADQAEPAEESAHEAPATDDLWWATDKLAETTDEQVAVQHQQSGMEDHPTVQMATIPDQPIGEPSADEEQPAEDQSTDEPAAAEEQPADEDQAPTFDQQPAEEERARETELLREVAQAANPADEQETPVGWRLDIAEYPLVHVGLVPHSENGGSDWNRDWSLDHLDTDNGAANGWRLYMDAYPQAYEGLTAESEDPALGGNWDWEREADDFNQDSPPFDTDDEADVLSPEPSLSANGEKHQPGLETKAEERPQNGARAGNGQISKGRDRQRARTRSRRRRSRHK
jgi:capsular polysaccharide biosynthesis protein